MTNDPGEAMTADPLEEAGLDESDTGSLVKAVQRALRIVSMFDSRHPEWTPSELGRQRATKTNAFRL
jgi:hypothetical protein